MSFDYFYSLTLAEYYIILQGFRAKQLNDLKTVRWQTWEIVRHAPFLKNPPKSPDKLLKFQDEVDADEAKAERAAERLKQAIKEHGRR